MVSWVILGILAVWGIAQFIRNERAYQKWAAEKDREYDR